MKSLVDHLSQYAAYHRDPRNIASHFIGIPMIVVAVAVLLSRPEWQVAGLWLSPAVLLAQRLHGLRQRRLMCRAGGRGHRGGGAAGQQGQAERQGGQAQGGVFHLRVHCAHARQGGCKEAVGF